MDFKTLIKKTEKRDQRVRKPFPSPESIVLTSRIRLARNLSNHPFPGWTKVEHRRKILEVIEPVVRNHPEFCNGFYAEMEHLSPLEKQLLVELHLISRELATRNDGCAVSINRSGKISLMINEEDHLRLQVILPGLSLRTAWDMANKLDDSFEKHLEFAFANDLGYLTACPSNLGSGLRASAMLHLPGLVLSGQIVQVVEAARQLGLTIRGIFGEGSQSLSNFFQISNQITLGEKESDLVSKLERVTTSLVKHEINARLKLKESPTTKQEILDRIGRSLGILTNAHSIGTRETLTHLSFLRLGCDFGILEHSGEYAFDKIMILIQSAYLQLHNSSDPSSDSKDRDHLRATLLRESLKQMNLQFSSQYSA